MILDPKKIVYLDQSLLSAAYLNGSIHELSILEKVSHLKLQQKIYVIISDVHVRETSAIPDGYAENRKKLWLLQNNLANGNICAGLEEVFIAQQRRTILSQDISPIFPISDIGLKSKDSTCGGVNIQLTNSWLLKLHREYTQPRNSINEELRKIFKRQLRDFPACNDINDCLKYVRDLWCKDILQGVHYWQLVCQQNLFIEEEHKANKVPSIKPYYIAAPFYRIVCDVMQGLDWDFTILRWLELLKDSNNLSASIKIRTAFEAELL